MGGGPAPTEKARFLALPPVPRKSHSGSPSPRGPGPIAKSRTQLLGWGLAPGSDPSPRWSAGRGDPDAGRGLEGAVQAHPGSSDVCKNYTRARGRAGLPKHTRPWAPNTGGRGGGSGAPLRPRPPRGRACLPPCPAHPVLTARERYSPVARTAKRRRGLGSEARPRAPLLLSPSPGRGSRACPPNSGCQARPLPHAFLWAGGAWRRWTSLRVRERGLGDRGSPGGPCLLPRDPGRGRTGRDQEC